MFLYFFFTYFSNKKELGDDDKIGTSEQRPGSKSWSWSADMLKKVSHKQNDYDPLCKARNLSAAR